MNLEKAVVHEIHEKTRKSSNAYPSGSCHPMGEPSVSLNPMLNFVIFVSFVDEKRF
jgi:hypothetical protein